MPTNVFISWSGELSGRLAEAIREWLPAALQNTKPYYSADDLEKGTKWPIEIAKKLDESDVGIICLTADNLDRPWLLFESGALAKRFDASRVCTILFNVDASDVRAPLALMQATKFEGTDFRRLMRTVNNACGDAKLDDMTLEKTFKQWWPSLKETVEKILAEGVPASSTPKRSERDLLEEILELVRHRRSDPELTSFLQSRSSALESYLQEEHMKRSMDSASLANLIEAFTLQFGMFTTTPNPAGTTRLIWTACGPLLSLSRRLGAEFLEPRVKLLRQHCQNALVSLYGVPEADLEDPFWPNKY